MDPILIGAIVGILIIAIVGYLVLSGRRSTTIEDFPAERKPTRTVVAAPTLRDRLGKTRRALSDRLSGMFGADRLDAEFWTDLEDTLVAADMGVATAAGVVEEVRRASPEDGAAARDELERRLVGLLDGRDRTLHRSGAPSVMLIVGVNGTGKTTSIAKLAARLQADGVTSVLGAADTFRAAAGAQLRTWGDRVGVRVVGGQEGADPASVAYDAYHAARAGGADVVIVDTAGRLHSKANLMDELAKVGRVLRREAGKIDEVLLVIDGTTGQNAIEQARTFTEAVGVTGIIVTKLDGTARGGMAIAVEQELGIPVKFIGVGEGMEDLVPFEPYAFVDALLGA